MENNTENGVVAQGGTAPVKMNISAETVENARAMVEDLSSMDELMEITSDYLKLEKDDSKRFIFYEMTEMQGMGENNEMVPAVKLMDEEGKFVVSAAKVLVGTCVGLVAPCPIQVDCKGKVKGKNGSYDDLVIIALGKK